MHFVIPKSCLRVIMTLSVNFVHEASHETYGVASYERRFAFRAKFRSSRDTSESFLSRISHPIREAVSAG